MTLHPMVAAAPPAVDGQVWSSLLARLTDAPLVGADDVAAAAAAFPPPREVGQAEHWDSEAQGPRQWVDEYGIGYAPESWMAGRWSGHSVTEGRTFRAELAPGALRLRVFDAARQALGEARAADRRNVAVMMHATFGAIEGGAGAPVREWSRKSRSRMVRTLATLDYTHSRVCRWCRVAEPDHGTGHRLEPLPHGMVTLTYAASWQQVVPTGAAAKRHLDVFRRAWRDRWGYSPVGLWKLEFQRRGAPHFHLWLPIPDAPGRGGDSFRSWLSSTWARIVGHDGVDRMRHELAGTAVDFASAARMGDTKRLAVYFLKHGTKTADDKEYQHNVPVEWQEPGAGPGRFWGYWKLGKAVAVVDLDLDDFIAARRVLRKVARRPGIRLRTLGAGGGMTGGFVLVNDGVALAYDLARWLQTRSRT